MNGNNNTPSLLSTPDSESAREPRRQRTERITDNGTDEENDGSFAALFAPDPLFVEIARATNNVDSEDENGREEQDRSNNQLTESTTATSNDTHLQVNEGNVRNGNGNVLNNTTNNTAATFSAAISTILEAAAQDSDNEP